MRLVEKTGHCLDAAIKQDYACKITPPVANCVKGMFLGEHGIKKIVGEKTSEYESCTAARGDRSIIIRLQGVGFDSGRVRHVDACAAGKRDG